jgi:thioredoxin-like negative regulator of GroEL
LKDDDRAAEAFRKGLEVSKSNFAWRNECFLGMIAILRKQGKTDEAAKAFESVDFSKLPGDYWKSAFALAYADVLVLQGKNGQASARLCEVLQRASSTAEQKRQAQKRLDAIFSEDGKVPDTGKSAKGKP